MINNEFQFKDKMLVLTFVKAYSKKTVHLLAFSTSDRVC